MATDQRTALRPMRVARSGTISRPDQSVPDVPEPLSLSPLAPDRINPTEGNGLHTPHATLHVALLVPKAGMAFVQGLELELLKPALWEGEIKLYLVPKEKIRVDATIAQYLVDSGQIDSTEIGLIGYPVSMERDQ